MTAQYILSNQQVFDTNGDPLAGAKLYFFESGTSTPISSYSESTLVTANAHPVVADSSGRFGSIYLGVDEYKVRLDTSADAVIFTNDPYSILQEFSAGAGLEASASGVRVKQLVNAQTGTTYTYSDSDRGKLVTHSNTNAIAATLPQAGASSEFASGWFMDVQNTGAGILTITPTTSTINGAASLAFSQSSGARIVSDGTNYFIQTGRAADVLDNVFRIVDNSDATKKIAFEASGITTATTRTITVPDKSGTMVMTSDLLVLGTPTATTSGTTKDITGIPAGVKRVTVTGSGVSGSGTSNLMLQLGDSGGIETSGYVGGTFGNTNTVQSSTAGVLLAQTVIAAGNNFSFAVIFTMHSSSANTWIAQGTITRDDGVVYFTSSIKSLSGVLDRVRITTIGGTDTLDAGEFNVMYE